MTGEVSFTVVRVRWGFASEGRRRGSATRDRRTAPVSTERRMTRTGSQTLLSVVSSRLSSSGIMARGDTSTEGSTAVNVASQSVILDVWAKARKIRRCSFCRVWRRDLSMAM